jgi:CubicO group peptidase (beta-lactamase class C family)
MKKIIILFLFLTGASGLIAQSFNLADQIDSLVRKNVTKVTPGCVVGIVKDGEVLSKQMYGLANMEYRIPVTDSTVFNLASVSKQFTAFLVLLLEKEGTLSLDDEIQKYIPELKNYGHPITVRQLLHHTSGIPSTDNLRLFAGLSLEMPWDVDDEFGMIQSYQKLNFAPNEEYNYSNAGYVLLTRIIEKSTGMSFAQCMAEKIFKPLNMKNAIIYDTPGKVIFNRASGYRKTGENFSKTNTEGESYFGSTNMYASVNDMIKWSVNLSAKSLGGEQLVERLFNPADTLNNGDTIAYTYGFNVWKYKGIKIVEHSGYTVGFKTQIMHFPDAGFSVFVLSNNENTEPWNIATQIVEWCLKDILKPDSKLEHKEIPINKDLYTDYKGSYQLPDGVVLQFDIVNDTLKLIIPGAPKFVLYPEKENEFFLKDFDAQCTFVKDSRGRVNEIIWHLNGQNRRGVRYTEPKPFTQKKLQGFAGRYEIPELNVTYLVSAKDNELTILLPKTFRAVNIDMNMKLKHIGGDKFFGSLSMLEFKRDRKGKTTGFVIEDVGRLRNIEFSKKD